MKRIVTIFILCFSAVLAQAQVIAVTATITDSDGQTWNNGTFSVTLVSSNGAPFYLGTPVSTAVQKGVLSGSGALAVSLNNTNTITPGGAQYQWTICSNTSAPCSQFLAPVTTTNLSTLLSSLVTAPRFAAGPTAFGYLDIEASPIPPPGGGYFNVTLGNGQVWNGTTWVNSGGGGGTTTFPLTGAASGGAAPGTTFNGAAGVTFDYHTVGAQQVIANSANIYSANSQVQADSIVSTPTNGLISFGDSITQGVGQSGSAYPVIIGADIGASVNNQGVSGDTAADMTWHIFTTINPGDQYNPILTSAIGRNDHDFNGVPAVPVFTKYQYAAHAWGALSSTNKVLATSGSITPTGSPSTDTTWAFAHGLTFTGTGTVPYTCQIGPSGVFYIWYKMNATAGTFTVNVDGSPVTDTVGGSGTVSVIWTLDPGAHQSSAVGLARFSGIAQGSHTCTAIWGSGTVTILGFGFPPVTRYRGLGSPRFNLGGLMPIGGNTSSATDAPFNAASLIVSQQLVADGLNIPFVDLDRALDYDLDFASSPTQGCPAGSATPIHPNGAPCGQLHIAQAFESAINSGLSCPAATGCTLGTTVTIPSTSAMPAGTGGLSTTPDPYGEIYASPYPGGSFSGFRYTLVDSPGANNNANGVYDHWSSGVVDYVGLFSSSSGINYPVKIANAAPTGSLAIDASGNTIISGGTNVVYICSGGTFAGLLSTSSAACTGGTGTATHLKIE